MGNIDIAGLLKKYRKNAKLSVKESITKLSEFGINISDKTMYSWESGYRQPDADTFMTLCAIYGVTSLNDIIEKTSESDYTESEAEVKKRIDSLTKAFESCGYIAPGGDLTDDQLRFCMGLVDFLDKYFGG